MTCWRILEEKAQKIFLKLRHKSITSKNHFLQEKMNNLKMMICNADSSQSSTERKKILQMKGAKFYFCGINGKRQGNTNNACKTILNNIVQQNILGRRVRRENKED